MRTADSHQTGTKLHSAAEAVLATESVISVWEGEQLYVIPLPSIVRCRSVPKQEMVRDGLVHKLDLRAVGIRTQGSRRWRIRHASSRGKLAQ